MRRQHARWGGEDRTGQGGLNGMPGVFVHVPSLDRASSHDLELRAPTVRRAESVTTRLDVLFRLRRPSTTGGRVPRDAAVALGNGDGPGAPGQPLPGVRVRVSS